MSKYYLMASKFEATRDEFDDLDKAIAEAAGYLKQGWTAVEVRGDDGFKVRLTTTMTEEQ